MRPGADIQRRNLTYSVTDKTAGEVDVSSCESYESEIDVPAR